jgi:hypothetical protein
MFAVWGCLNVYYKSLYLRCVYEKENNPNSMIDMRYKAKDMQLNRMLVAIFL